jgi:gamma-glutamylcyclotransferase
MKYFAYGSNMAGPVMDAACAEHRFLGPARLPGYKFAFMRRSVRTGTGVADILPDPEGSVWGALYELERDRMGALDRKETLGSAYEHLDVVVLTDDGTSHGAMAYSVIVKEPVEVRPSLIYVQGLVQGARERSLPQDYLASLQALVLEWELEPPTAEPGSGRVADGSRRTRFGRRLNGRRIE